MAQSISQELLDLLAEAGAKTIFGVTGDALNPFVDAIRRDGRFEWITVRHEETGAFAAAAQAKLSGTLAVCCGTVGPGALHLLNGLYDAKRDYAPVLAITGQVPELEYGNSYFQEVDLETVFSDVTVYNETVRSPEQFQRIAQQAIQTAINESGVAHISLPVDIIGQNTPNTPHKRPIFRPLSVSDVDEQALQAAASTLGSSKRLTILIGDGAREASEQVAELAGRLNAPVVNTLKATDVLPFDHPLRMGGIGHLGTPQGLAALDQCDTLLMVGADFPYHAFLPGDVPIVQIDQRANHIGRRCPVSHPVVGDAKTVVERLLSMLEPRSEAQFLDKIDGMRRDWMKRLDAWSDTGRSDSIVHPQVLVRRLCERADDDAVFVADVGTITVWAGRHLRMRKGQRLFGSFNHGSLGVGLPAAIGLKLLDRNRQVIALCGDGAFGMLMADFVTAVKYQLPVVVLVLNNGKFGFVELEMQASGYPRHATDLDNPDFALFAEACGGVGLRLDDPRNIDEVLGKALSSSLPVIIDAHVNPNELVLPPKIDAKHALGYAVGKMKELWIETVAS